MKGKTLYLKASDVRHLRRLLGYVRCEIGQEPDELVATVRGLLEKIGEPSDEGKARIMASHKKAVQVPQYVRAAIKALERLLFDEDGQVLQAKRSNHETACIGVEKVPRIQDDIRGES